MSRHSKRVYSGQDIGLLRYLYATDDYVKELGGQSSLLHHDGLDQQQQEHTFQIEHPSAAAEQAIPDSEQGLDQYQDAFHPQLSFDTQNDVQSQFLVENQPITYLQDDNHGALSVVLQDNPQRSLSAVVQNDAGKSSEQNQIVIQPQLVPASCLTFVEKLKRGERRTVSYSDYKTLLQGETQEMGGYRIPLLLHPIFENIVTSYGDITSNSLLSSFSAENVLLQFLATIKEMGDTCFEQVTEDLIFKWKGCIADAQLIKFNVDFAREHFNKIAKSYLSRKAGNQLSSIDKRILVLETAE